jgi:hypothetical protein
MRVPITDRTRWLGYSIETYCTKMKYYPADQREHRGLAYGKQRFYFDPSNGEYKWAGVLGPAIVAQAPGIDPKNGRSVAFEVIATVDAPGDDLFEQNLTNLGVMYRDPWTENLAKSKFMVSRLCKWLSLRVPPLLVAVMDA